MSVTLEIAERWMRHVAAKPDGMDTGESFRLVVAELDRLRAIEKRAQNLVTINEQMTSRTARVILGEPS